jgi:hypothetical protein
LRNSIQSLDKLEALQIVLVPTRLQFDHRPQCFGRESLPGMMERYRHAAAIGMKEMLMGTRSMVDHEAIAQQGIDEPPRGEIPETSIVDHIKP